jgi:sugar phosphate isomerase/epimerase
MPCHDQLTYRENFRLHTRRLRQVAQMLDHYGLRLGLEYVGTQTLRNRRRYPFLHTMAETKELITEIGEKNVGLVLDSWHWYTAGETAADILTLGGEEIVAGDLNDAPAGIPVEEQEDGRRELPMATGVIDLAAFMNALKRAGFAGPVRAEPFNHELNQLDDDEACARTAGAMKKAFALIR